MVNVDARHTIDIFVVLLMDKIRQIAAIIKNHVQWLTVWEEDRLKDGVASLYFGHAGYVKLGAIRHGVMMLTV